MTRSAAARRRRRARLRATAMPTFLLAVNPTRGTTAPAQGAACRIRPGATCLRRLAATARNSARRFRRTILVIGCASTAATLGSGRKTLATLGATARQNAAPADRRRARAKAVATLADKFARLISALHGSHSGEASRKIDGAVYGSGWPKSTPQPRAKVTKREGSMA